MFKKVLLSLTILSILSFSLVVPLRFVLAGCDKPANANEQAQCGLGTAVDKGYGSGYTKENKIDPAKASLAAKIGTIVGAFLAFLGAIFLLLMIYAGIMWMTARGNDQRVEKAKNILESSIIGLIITIGAYAITAFVGNVILK